ncbi:hypothetical protein SDC9_151849 [bioreactor metagenome]|uniref:Uncharacterized protein n=1 Tax=bioreactor metagenome TaxID=1076179 RepID=A0A645ET54_9ZZZZ
MAPAVRIPHIIRGEQNLRHGMIIFGKKLIIGIHQFALAHGGSRLLGGHIFRPSGQHQLAHAHADGSRTYQDHLMSGILQIAEHLYELLHMPYVHPPCTEGQSGRADLNNNAHASSLAHCLPKSRVLS